MTGINGYTIVSRNKPFPLRIKTNDKELIRQFLAAKHHTQVNDIVFRMLYKIQHKDFEPSLK